MATRASATRTPWWSKQFVRLHIGMYRATGGVLGHRLSQQRTLLLTTTGRKTGLERTQPLTYLRVEDELVLVASNWGNDYPPAWYLNLVAHPQVRVQLKRDVFDAIATSATPGERARLWPQVVAQMDQYARYQAGTEREIPLVLVRRAQSAS